MNAFDKARLGKKYGWKGGRYETLIGKILKENQEKIARVVTGIDQTRFEAQINQLRPKKPGQKKVIIPDARDLIKRSPTIIKAASQGELLTKTLREKLSASIKKTLLTENVTTTRGTVRKNLAEKVKAGLKDVYSTYTRNDPVHEMPANIHAIAVTETRTVVNTVRNEYVKEVAKETGAETKKKWIHNGSLSQTARKGHVKLSRQRAIGIHEQFEVQGFKMTKGKWQATGEVYRADHPHDSTLPASETINCSCELEYTMEL
jgi:hypothetical protein